VTEVSQPSKEQTREWRCFHCDEVLRSSIDARLHFGGSEASDPACLIKAAGEFALLQAFRNSEDELARYRNEDSDVLRVLWSTRADQAEALRREEEKGYARGLEDAKAHPETLGLQRAAPEPSADYHRVMRLLRDTRRPHVTCSPREIRACSHCNAVDDLKTLVDEYKGPSVLAMGAAQPP
jgi:hypothetical protein